MRGDDYIILRERDIHAVAAERLEEGSTGLYLCSVRAAVHRRAPTAAPTAVRWRPCPSPRPSPSADEQLAAVRYDADGLVPAIVQEEGTGEVLMMAWMNEDDPAPDARRGPHRVLEPLPPGGVAQGRHLRRPPVRARGRPTTATATRCCSSSSRRARGACHTGDRSCFFRAFGARAAAPVIRPSRDEFRALARGPHRRPGLAGAAGRPRSRRWPPSPGCAGDEPGFLLESVEHGERWSRWSFVGRQPAGHPRRPRAAASRSTATAARRHARSTGACSPRSRRCSAAYRSPVAARPAAAARRAGRLPRLRRRARGRAPARRPPTTTSACPTRCCRSSASWPPSTTGASGSR